MIFKPLNPKKSKPLAFWVTNASPRNVTLSDLALNIRAYSTVNLLDSKHYTYTLQQLQTSASEGSIFKKQQFILVRKLPPPETKPEQKPFLKDAVIPDRTRSIFNIEQQEYDELKVSDGDQEMQKRLDEEYAKENAELEISNEGVKEKQKAKKE